MTNLLPSLFVNINTFSVTSSSTSGTYVSNYGGLVYREDRVVYNAQKRKSVTLFRRDKHIFIEQ